MKINLTVISVFLLIQCNPDSPNQIDLDFHPQALEVFAPDIVSTNLYERDIAISPDGNEIIFTLGDYNQSRRCLVLIKKNGSKWGEREVLSFSGKYSDIEPFFSPDGRKLYFASNRPVAADTNRSDYNIWVSERVSQGWGNPQILQPDINTKNDEFFPSVSKNNNLYFTAARNKGIGKEDIFLSRYMNGEYLEPEVLDSNINTPTYEFNAYVNPDENLIVFSSYGRKDDLGGGDLYYSKKNSSGEWLPAINMGPLINSDKLDYCPFIDVSRNNFYFTSDRSMTIDKRIENAGELEQLANGILNGMGNIYRVPVDQLNLK